MGSGTWYNFSSHQEVPPRRDPVQWDAHTPDNSHRKLRQKAELRMKQGVVNREPIVYYGTPVISMPLPGVLAAGRTELIYVPARVLEGALLIDEPYDRYMDWALGPVNQAYLKCQSNGHGPQHIYKPEDSKRLTIYREPKFKDVMQLLMMLDGDMIRDRPSNKEPEQVFVFLSSDWTDERLLKVMREGWRLNGWTTLVLPPA